MDLHTFHHVKSSVITYLMNLATLSVASLTFIEGADILLKCISVIVALVVLFFTYRRLKRDLKLRDIEIKIKESQERQEDQKLYMLMQQTKLLEHQNNLANNGAETKIKIE